MINTAKQQKEHFMPRKGYKWSKERYKDFIASGGPELKSKQFKGIPKSEEQKQKMSEAKLGVEKSESHRESMSRAHRERWAKWKKVKELYPDLSISEAWVVVNANPELFV